MHLSIFLVLDGLLSCLLASALAVGGVPLHPRAAQSMAVCSASFAWMDNSNKISPCQAAASLDALCNSGNWILPALNASVKYNMPATQDGTATLCTCSWASYNLVSACTACQGFPEQIPQWSFYSVGCGGFLSDVAFPSNITLPESVSIPFWAGEDPSKWPGETFNVNTAQQIASEGHADLSNSPNTPSTPKKSKSVSAGAILAIIFAGLGLILVIGIISYLLYRRRKSRQPLKEPPRVFPNLKVMRLSATRPISSPYRTFFAPPAYTESTANLNGSGSVYRYNAHLDRTDTVSSIDTHHSHSRVATDSSGHEMTNTWGFNNPSPLIALPQPAARGWIDRKPSAVDHKRRQLRLVS